MRWYDARWCWPGCLCVMCLPADWWKYHVLVLTRAQVRQWWVCHHDQQWSPTSGQLFLSLPCQWSRDVIIMPQLDSQLFIFSKIFDPSNFNNHLHHSLGLILVLWQTFWLYLTLKILFGCLQTWDREKHYYPPTWQNNWLTEFLTNGLTHTNSNQDSFIQKCCFWTELQFSKFAFQ